MGVTIIFCNTIIKQESAHKPPGIARKDELTRHQEWEAISSTFVRQDFLVIYVDVNPPPPLQKKKESYTIHLHQQVPGGNPSAERYWRTSKTDRMIM